MFKICKIYTLNKSNEIEIISNEDLYGLCVGGVTTKEGLDNIFAYGDNLFVLVSNGKFGVVQYDDCLNEIYSLPCEYDTLDDYWHNLLFSDKDGVVYYNSASKKWMRFVDVYISDGFVYAEDTNAYLIIEQASGRIIWNQYKHSEHLMCGPCYVFCGRTDGSPEFYDINNQDYISGVNGKYVRYKKFELVKPIIVNGQNVVGICEKNNKLGLIDVGNRKTVVPQWENVTVELKITLKNDKHETEKIYHVADFKAGDVIPVEEW